MDTRYAETGSDDDQPVLVEVPGPAGIPIGKRLWLVEGDGQRAVFLGATAIHVYDVDDRDAQRVCIATLSRAGLAFDVEIGEAFGCHRNTVARLARQLTEQGLAGVVAAKRGPKGPHKVTGQVEAVIDAGVAAGAGPAEVTRQVVESTGIELSREHVRQLMAARRPERVDQLALVADESDEVVESDDDTDADEDDDIDIDSDDESDDESDVDDIDGIDSVEDDDGTVDEGEAEGYSDRGGVSAGFDPPAVLPQGVVGDYIGLTLFYPALAALGLIEVARQTFALPRSERFGVRAVTLTLLFLTLLGKPTVEAAKHLRRRSFGAVVGTGRAPAVKTLRRKLAGLAAQGRAGEFGTALARRWVEGGIIDTAYLYVDGHMQAYTGKRRLEKVWSTKRRMPLPGIHIYHVGDSSGRPLLFVTEQLSTNLAKAMPRIVAAIREAIGEDRKFTIIFDRGGFDGKLFAWLDEQGIGFITYQRGNPNLPRAAFVRRETRFEGRRIRMHIAQDQVQVGGTGPWRRVVVRTPDGHQTPILTNLEEGKVGPARLACLVFARWRQENLFKYMGQHHGLDQLVSYASGPADPDTLVVNPQRKQLDRDIATKRRELAKLKADLGDVLLDEPKIDSRSGHGLKIAQHGAVGRLRALEADIDKLVTERNPLPKHVTVAELEQPREIMQLEHKHIVDRIKICAYNAEEWLLDRLVDLDEERSALDAALPGLEARR
ncbi:MAG: putative transposase, partial [Nitriliruptoraceae bacterium]